MVKYINLNGVSYFADCKISRKGWGPFLHHCVEKFASWISGLRIRVFLSDPVWTSKFKIPVKSNFSWTIFFAKVIIQYWYINDIVFYVENKKLRCFLRVESGFGSGFFPRVGSESVFFFSRVGSGSVFFFSNVRSRAGSGFPQMSDPGEIHHDPQPCCIYNHAKNQGFHIRWFLSAACALMKCLKNEKKNYIFSQNLVGATAALPPYLPN